jgi:hypothetical protein
LIPMYNLSKATGDCIASCRTVFENNDDDDDVLLSALGVEGGEGEEGGEVGGTGGGELDPVFVSGVASVGLSFAPVSAGSAGRRANSLPSVSSLERAW